MHRRLVITSAAAIGAALVLASCAGSAGTGSGSGKPVELVFWTWTPNMDKVADVWNQAHPEIQVRVEKQSGGDDVVRDTISAVDIGLPPDLVQVEYQALPTLVQNGVLVDISERTSAIRDRFADGVWQQVTNGSGAVYAVPQDIAPLMFYYRQDLFAQYGLQVPTTWAEFADTARALKKRAPGKALTTFSPADPGLFAGLAQQAGAKWWTGSGDAWKVAVDDAATKKVADFWGGLVKEGAIDNRPMYTPEWIDALKDGTQIAWVSAVWAPGVLASYAQATKGKWAMEPLPQWKAGEEVTGSWGGSGTGVTVGAAKNHHVDAATKFVTWLNTDPEAIAALVKGSGIYPAATAGQTSGALPAAPDFFPNQPDFYAKAARSAKHTAPAAWGPDVDIAYAAFKDAFGKAARARSDFGPALTAVQQSTVAGLQQHGIAVDE